MVFGVSGQQKGGNVIPEFHMTSGNPFNSLIAIFFDVINTIVPEYQV